jgi:hypothetical protein
MGTKGSVKSYRTIINCRTMSLCLYVSRSIAAVIVELVRAHSPCTCRSPACASSAPQSPCQCRTSAASTRSVADRPDAPAACEGDPEGYRWGLNKVDRRGAGNRRYAIAYCTKTNRRYAIVYCTRTNRRYAIAYCTKTNRRYAVACCTRTLSSVQFLLQ